MPDQEGGTTEAGTGVNHSWRKRFFNRMIKRLILLSFLTLSVQGCALWHPIAYRSVAAVTADNALYHDIVVFTANTQPPSPFSAKNYAPVEADITICRTTYNALGGNNLSLDQLNLLSDELRRYRVHDSTGMSVQFYAITAPLIVATAAQIDSLEQYKILAP